MLALWLTAGVLGQASETPFQPLPRGDDGNIYFSGQARKAIYQRLIDELEGDVSAPPEKVAAKRKAKTVVKRLEQVNWVNPVAKAEAVRASQEKLRALRQEQIDYMAFSSALIALLREEAARQASERRRRRNRSIAFAMLMAA